MQISNLTNAGLDLAIVAGNLEALDERSRRARFIDPVLAGLRADLERAWISGRDVELDFGGNSNPEIGATVYLVIEGVARRLTGSTPAEVIESGRAVLDHFREIEITLTPAQIENVGTELERCQGRPTYAGLVLRGRKLTGTRRALQDLADGIEATSSDEDLAMLAETRAANSKGYPTDDALEARAEFIARALRGSRDKLLRALRR